MSDTPDELLDLAELNDYRGRLLVGGLGLGCAIAWALDHTEVEHVTVIEKSADVLALTGDYWRARFGDRLEIIEADLFEWNPGDRRFDFGWLDIWDTLSGDNLDEFVALREKFADVVAGAIGCWGERFLLGRPGGIEWLVENDLYEGEYCDQCGDPHAEMDTCHDCDEWVCGGCAEEDPSGYDWLCWSCAAERCPDEDDDDEDDDDEDDDDA
jgi:hypothetical protein